MEETITNEKCACGMSDDLFRLQDDEGYICRECLFSQYDFVEERSYEDDM